MHLQLCRPNQDTVVDQQGKSPDDFEAVGNLELWNLTDKQPE